MSLPKQTGNFISELIILGLQLSNTSLIATPTGFLLGISIPTVVLPGIGASIRTSIAAKARAISLDKPVILLILVPFLTANSN